jgi:hypothetical protein
MRVASERSEKNNDGAITSCWSVTMIGAHPSLVMNVAADLFGTFDSAHYTARHISDARFIGYNIWRNSCNARRRMTRSWCAI